MAIFAHQIQYVRIGVYSLCCDLEMTFSLTLTVQTEKDRHLCRVFSHFVVFFSDALLTETC